MRKINCLGYKGMVYNYKENKITAVLADGIEMWQALNVLGHMAVSLGANKDADLMGRDILTDKSGGKHLGIARYGFIIKKADMNSIKELVARAKNDPGVVTVDFPREMIETAHDDELAEAVAAKDSENFDYFGVLLYGPAAEVDKLTKQCNLWK